MKTRTLFIRPHAGAVDRLQPGAPLPGGYGIFIASSSEIMLTDPQRSGVAGANLTQIGNSGVLIFGEIQTSGQGPAGNDTPGFFILDSSTGVIEKGLSREDWLTKLKKAGLQGEPELVSPAKKGTPPRLMIRLKAIYEIDQFRALCGSDRSAKSFAYGSVTNWCEAWS